MPAGARQPTLIEELVLRFLHARPANARVAILSHDPSIGGNGAGALLGDRATMIYSQNDRVFMRSMATRGQAGGLSPSTGRCLEILAGSGEFELVIIETVGTGQEALPFSSELVDFRILVMNPDYGSRLQLQKIAMLDAGDVAALNGLFWASPHTTRFGIGENLFGHDAIANYRSGVWTKAQRAS